MSAVEATGLQYAFLHGETAAASGEAVTDLDLAVGCSPAAFAAALARTAREAGLLSIEWWPYDTTGAALFLVSQDGRRGVQVDLLGDQHGTGKYGLRTGPLLSRREQGSKWMTAAPLDSAIYQSVKRIIKGDRERAAAIVGGLLDRGWVERAQEILSDGHFKALGQLVSGEDPAVPPRPFLAQALRHYRRIREPAGAIISTPRLDPNEVSNLLGSVTLGAIAPTNGLVGVVGNLLSVWRGRFVVTASPRRVDVSSWIATREDDLGEGLTEITHDLASRTTATLARAAS